MTTGPRMEARGDYDLSKIEADDVLAQTMSAWRSEATHLRIPKAEQGLMASAFGQ
jgi:hypothetical protein